MPTPTVPVTVTLASQDGVPYVGVIVRARLDANEVYQGIVISDVVEAVTDAAGVAILNLFPNAPAPTGLGTQGSTYRVYAVIPNGFALNVDARVPNAACRIEDIIVNSTAVPLDAAQLAVLQAQGYSVNAEFWGRAAAASALEAQQVAGLMGSETTGIAIDATASKNYAVKVLDAVNPLNNRLGGVMDVLTGVFGQPKMVIASDGRAVRWSPHNFAKQTTTPGSNVTGATPVAGQPDSDGGTTAAKITATSAVLSAFQHITVGGAGYFGMYFMQEWIVRAGTSSFCFIAFVTGGPTYKQAFFNLNTGTVGTVDAGVTATISQNRADGTALPAGYYRITACYNPAAASYDAVCGQCDADGSRAVTIGRTLFAEKPFVHLGVNAMDYFANTGVVLKVGVPYDYSRGGARILIEPTITYNSSYADDLTNAVWTKSASMVPTLSTTGPHGEACSTLTAGAPNQTCIQAIVSGTATQNFSAFVRRRTGAGSISITSDNGATWTDITGQLNSTTYTRVQVNGIANPNIGFKIAANGDAIDVALAVNVPKAYMSSPLPCYNGGSFRAGDPFVVPLSLLTAGSAYTVYADYDRLTGPAFADDTNFRVGNLAMSQEMWLGSDSAGNATFNVFDGVTNKSYGVLWNYASGERLEVTTKVEANKHIISMGGEPPAQITTVGLPAPMEQVRLGFGGPVFLRRLLIVPRAVDRDQIRTWRYAGGMRNQLVAAEVVSWDSDPAVPNTTMCREPSLCVLSDDGDTADIAVFHLQKHDTGFHVEAPARLIQRNYRANKTDGTLIPLTNAAVVQQQANWVLGLGHLQSPCAFVVPTGANAGRVVLLFSGLESPNFTPIEESIYVMTNDPNGNVRGDPTRWSAATKIVDAPPGEGYATDPSGSVVILPPTHPVAPNRVIVSYYNGTWVKSLYSDNWGATWTSGTAFAPAGIILSESALSLWPDGTVILTSRVESGTLTRRNWAKSTDGGVSFVDQGVLPAFSYGQCSAGAVQVDPTGLRGPYGKTALCHAANATTRRGLQIDFATDAAMTFGNPVKPVSIGRYFGYNSIKSLFGGSHVLVAAEGGSVPFNLDNTPYLLLVKLP